MTRLSDLDDPLALPALVAMRSDGVDVVLHLHWLGLSGWRWLLILEGVPAFVCGIITLFYLTDWPKDAAWLQPAERDWITGELDRESRAKKTERGHAGILETLRQPVVLALALSYFFLNTSGYGLNIWLPKMVQKFPGLTTTQINAVATDTLDALDLTKLSTAQLAGLTTTSVTNLTETQVGTLTSTQVGKLTSAQIGALTSTEVQAFTTTQANALTSTQLGSLTTTAVGNLSTTQVTALSTAQVQGLTTVQLNAVSANALDALASVADHHHLVAVALDHDGRGDPHEPFDRLAAARFFHELIDHDGGAVGQLVTGQTEQLFAHRLGHEKALVAVGQFVFGVDPVLLGQILFTDAEQARDVVRAFGRHRYELRKRMAFLHALQPGRDLGAALHGVELVGDQQRRHVRAQQREHLCIGQIEAAGLHHEQHEVHITHRALHGLVQRPVQRVVVSGLKPRCVDIDELGVAQRANAGDPVPRGLCLA